jgi:hypothetical protein
MEFFQVNKSTFYPLSSLIFQVREDKSIGFTENGGNRMIDVKELATDELIETIKCRYSLSNSNDFLKEQIQSKVVLLG